eukprot:3048741-Amphidinium_carterae.1
MRRSVSVDAWFQDEPLGRFGHQCSLRKSFSETRNIMFDAFSKSRTSKALDLRTGVVFCSPHDLTSWADHHSDGPTPVGSALSMSVFDSNGPTRGRAPRKCQRVVALPAHNNDMATIPKANLDDSHCGG